VNIHVPTSSRAAWIFTDTLVVALSVADLYLSSVAIRSLPFVLSVLAIVALVLRRRHPIAALTVGLPNVVWGYALLAQLVATFTVAHRVSDRRRVVGMIGLVAVAQVVGMFVLPDNAPTEYGAQRLVFAVLIVGGPATLGLLLRAYQQLSQQLAELTARRERERDLVTRTVLAQERTRLAREMHDVVSHQVSLIAVQAGALRMTAADQATRATASTLRTLAAKTLTELREMVAVLRDADHPTSEIAPQPRMSDLPRLVRDSGTGAVLLADSVLDLDLPEPTERAVYRTVQEALTNVRKHATGAAVTVELDGDAEGLRIHVRNGPPPAATGPLLVRADSLPGGGHGLIGLRERAELLGGGITHRHTSDGGFELIAKLPTRPASASSGNLLPH